MLRIYENYRRVALEIRRRYALKCDELTLISSDFRRRDGLLGLSLAMWLADKGRCIIIYGLPATNEEELVPLLREKPNVRFLNSPWDKEGICRAYNELRAPWLPHNALPNPKAKKTKNS